jgi:hypothetical protein
MRLGLFLSLFLLLGGCVTSAKVPVLSPSSGGDQTVGYNRKTDVDTSARSEEGPAGGIVGKIGGGSDSIALWLAIASLGLMPFVYPASRKVRFLWNGWRGRSSSKKGKGSEVCIKLSEWDSSS